MQTVASGMIAKTKLDKYKYQPQWWDCECDRKNKIKKKCLNNFRKSQDQEDLILYIKAKTEFKDVCKRKSSFTGLCSHTLN